METGEPLCWLFFQLLISKKDAILEALGVSEVQIPQEIADGLVQLIGGGNA